MRKLAISIRCTVAVHTLEPPLPVVKWTENPTEKKPAAMKREANELNESTWCLPTGLDKQEPVGGKKRSPMEKNVWEKAVVNVAKRSMKILV